MRRQSLNALIGLATCMLAFGAAQSAAQDIAGAGATFPYPIYAKWAAAYYAETGAKVSYEPVGSGLGITLIQQGSVTFGGSDMPLKPQELDAKGLIQFPTVAGGDVPVVNLPGVAPSQMTLDGPTLANIYLGNIKIWNDPAIKRLNTGLSLPAQPIVVIHRSDGSGTTFIWADYLSKVSSEWKRLVGASTVVEWPVGDGAKGNDGVADLVARTSGAIGYVEYAYAVQKKLSYTKVVNRTGTAVAPSLESFKAAVADADWSAAPSFYLVLTDQPGHDAWPITGATFILMRKQPKDSAASAQALKFFAWAYEKGGDMALQLNYVPMTDQAVDRVRASWQKISPQ